VLGCKPIYRSDQRRAIESALTSGSDCAICEKGDFIKRVFTLGHPLPRLYLLNYEQGCS